MNVIGKYSYKILCIYIYELNCFFYYQSVLTFTDIQQLKTEPCIPKKHQQRGEKLTDIGRVKGGEAGVDSVIPLPTRHISTKSFLLSNFTYNSPPSTLASNRSPAELPCTTDSLSGNRPEVVVHRRCNCSHFPTNEMDLKYLPNTSSKCVCVYVHLYHIIYDHVKLQPFKSKSTTC